MPQAESNRVSIRISEETNWGETPSTPAMVRIPYTSDSLGHNKRVKQSDTLRADRMRDAQVQVGRDANGDINFELRFGDHEKFLEHALAATFVTASKTGAGTSNNVAFANAGGGVQVITGNSGAWNSFLVGAWVRVKSAAQAANNGIFKVTAKDATTITVTNSAGVSEADSTAVITQKCLRNGTTKKSLLIEKQFEDLTNNYLNFRGMRVAGLSLAFQTEQIVTGTVRFMGKSGHIATATVSGSLSGPGTTDSMTASLNVSHIVEDGSSLSAAVKSFNMDLNNNTRSLSAVGNVDAIGVNYGSLTVTGRLEAFYEDQVLYTKVFSHEESSLELRLTDPDENVMVITLPHLHFSGNVSNPGIDQDNTLPMEYATHGQTGGYQIQIDALAA